MSEEDFVEFDEESLPGSPPSLVSALLCSIFSFLFSIGCCYFAIFSISFRSGLYDSTKDFSQYDTRCKDSIPYKYLVNHSYLFPVNYSLNNNITSKISWFLYMLESHYRILANKQEIFSNDHYLKFSEKIVLEALSKSFNVSEDDFIINFGSLCNQSYIGHPMEIAKSLENDEKLRKSAFPLCFNESMSENPFSFHLVSTNISKGIESIKRRIVENGRPVFLSFKRPINQLKHSSTIIQFPELSMISLDRIYDEIILSVE